MSNETVDYRLAGGAAIQQLMSRGVSRARAIYQVASAILYADRVGVGLDAALRTLDIAGAKSRWLRDAPSVGADGVQCRRYRSAGLSSAGYAAIERRVMGTDKSVSSVVLDDDPIGSVDALQSWVDRQAGAEAIAQYIAGLGRYATRHIRDLWRMYCAGLSGRQLRSSAYSRCTVYAHKAGMRVADWLEAIARSGCMDMTA